MFGLIRKLFSLGWQAIWKVLQALFFAWIRKELKVLISLAWITLLLGILLLCFKACV